MSRAKYIYSVLVIMLLALTASTPLKASNSLAISNIASIPGTIVDTQSYSLSFFVINTDPSAYLTDEVSIQMQIDGETPFSLNTAVAPNTDVAPGDSFEITIPGYQFPAPRFRGTSVTHDIIVWPMRLVGNDADSIRGQLIFEHTNALSSDAIGLVNPVGVPNEVVHGETYDLVFDVINQDADYHLYHPIDIVYTINGEGPYLWIEDYALAAPLAPGEQAPVSLSNYIFPSERHGSSSVTHDIIVWPMAQFISAPDPVNLSVTFLPLPLEAIITGPGTNVDNSAGTPAPLVDGFQILPNSDAEILLEWETQYESVAGTFVVLPAHAGASPKPILTIAHQGNPELPATYSIPIPRPRLEKEDYHLLYVTADETYNLATAQMPAHVGPEMLISGNPVQPASFIQVWVAEASPASLVVFDQGGRQVYQHQQTAATGWLQLDLEQLVNQPEGLYYYRLAIGKTVHSGTLMRE